MAEPILVSAAVEGLVDEAVVRRIIQEVGGYTGPVYGKNGKASLSHKIKGYNQAAMYRPWLVIVDLNHEVDCAPLLRATWLPDPAAYMCFRVAVRTVEAWLLADYERLSEFMNVDAGRIPKDPEKLADPKKTLVELARHSRSSVMREDMVPRSGSGRLVGPAYTSRLIEFVTNVEEGWRPPVAAECSRSLNHCLQRLRKLLLMAVHRECV